jgi:hypothetical protein
MGDQQESVPPEAVTAPPAHVAQAKEIIRQTAPTLPQQPDIETLIEVAEPLVRLYFESIESKHKREIEYQTKVLEFDAKRESALTVAFSVITLSVLFFAGYLIAQGRETVAIDLIVRLVSIAGAAFGAYGLAMAKRRREENDD